MTSKKTIMPSVKDLRNALSSLKRRHRREPLVRIHVAVLPDRWLLEENPAVMLETGAYAEAYTNVTPGTRADDLARDIVTSLREQYIANPKAPALPHLRHRTRHTPKEPNFVADLATEPEGEDLATHVPEHSSAHAAE